MIENLSVEYYAKGWNHVIVRVFVPFVLCLSEELILSSIESQVLSTANMDIYTTLFVVF